MGAWYECRLFAFLVIFCCFLTTTESAITKSVATSSFLTNHGYRYLPYVWGINIPINFCISIIYNRALPSLGCRSIFIYTCILGCLINISSIFLLHYQTVSFLFYLWKDIFIVLAFHQIWSVINSTIEISKAKFLYCAFFTFGGLGSATGGIITSTFSLRVTTERLLLFTIPIYLALMVTYSLTLKARHHISFGQDINKLNSLPTDYFNGMRIIYTSKLLQLVLLLVIFIQLSSTILDYQFSRYIEKIFTSKDLRTLFLGQFFTITNLINVFMQGFIVFPCIKILGLKNSHLIVPIFMSINVIYFYINPSFPILAISYASIKVLDYSLFSISKELLYVPMKISDKFQPKSTIDIFIFRGAKTLASITILISSFIFGDSVISALSISLVVIFMLWVLSILIMFKHYYIEVGKEDINWPHVKEMRKRPH